MTKVYDLSQKRRQWARRRFLSPMLAPILAVVVALGVAYLGAQYLSSSDFALSVRSNAVSQIRVQFVPCVGATTGNCVVDGDTIWMRGEKIRISDIDTPEMFSPRCASELALGQKAAYRLQVLLNAGPIEIIKAESRDRDRYGRLLREIHRNGQSLGDVLVSEGLAHRWDGARREWCV